MSPVCIRDPPAIVVVDHNRIDIFRWAECFSGPSHTSELFFGRVACVDIRTLPCFNEAFWFDGLEVIKCRLDILSFQISSDD